MLCIYWCPKWCIAKYSLQSRGGGSVYHIVQVDSGVLVVINV